MALSLAEQISLLTPSQRSWLLDNIPADKMLYEWRLWARPEQIAPSTDWNVWLIKAGRGFGKTRAGAEWIREKSEDPLERIALIGRTAADVRDVMVEGHSGLMRIFPDNDKPLYEPSKRRITFKSGAIATTYSADEPNLLRGPQFTSAWADELAAWKYDRDSWDNLMFGLRLGERPQACVTTTPRPTKLIRELMSRKDCVVTGGSTYANAGNLANSFIESILKKYQGTRLGRQEIEAEVLDDNPGALWTGRLIEQYRVRVAPNMKRMVIAIDPAVTSNPDSDETGLIGAGIGEDDHCYIMADLSGIFPADTWARLAVNWYKDNEADRIVAEVNNGGDLVESTIRTISREVSYKSVRATRGKTLRAEPVAALYEQGKVHHVGQFSQLEDQMTTYDPQATNNKSPDRMDAMVWAVTDLMLGDASSPRVRLL